MTLAYRLFVLLWESDPGRQRALVRFWWLWIGLLLVGLLLIGVVAAMGRGRRTMTSLSRKRRRPIKDAWAEAGRRAEPEPLEFEEPPEESPQ